MTLPSAFFIIGTERSGSNLLRVIFDAHSDVVVPHPPHLLKYLSSIEPHYGSLSSERARARMVDDLLSLVHRHIHPWDWVPSAETLLGDTAGDPSVTGAFLALYDRYAEHHGARFWGCKSTFVVDHVPKVLERRPTAKFIWLARDVRDVAVSSKRSVFNPFHPLLTAELWARQQKVAHDLWRELGPETVLRLHYEDLIASPELMVACMCDFLGLTLHESMLAFHERRNASTTASYSQSWENANKPVMRNNSGKWRTGLTTHELELVEGVARETMELLGYEVETSAARPSEAEFARARLLDWPMRLESEWRSLRSEEMHWLRWGRRVNVALMELRARVS
ncbi:MAG: sulfotransferase [Proteobacteria bacterium]|nr:sulfotransferase [Pseudomonadota bacterium]MCP4915973.1 sulfotransferase [Pseudomonadota bacterium]